MILTWLLAAALAADADPLPIRTLLAQQAVDGRLVYTPTVILRAPETESLAVQGGAILAWNGAGRVFHARRFDAGDFAQWSGMRTRLAKGQEILFTQRLDFLPGDDARRLAYVFRAVGADLQPRRLVQWFALAEGTAPLPDLGPGKPRWEVRTCPDRPQGVKLPRSGRVVWGFDLWLQETNGSPVTVQSYEWLARDAQGHVVQEARQAVAGEGGASLTCGPDATLVLGGQRLVTAAGVTPTELALVVNGQAADGTPLVAMARCELAPPAAERAGRTTVRLPLRGAWRVLSGPGDPPHVGNQSYGWVFDVVDRAGKPCGGDGSRASDHYAYRRPVLAPAAGVVRATVCTYDDAGVPRVGGLFGDGLGENYLLLEHGNGECSYLGGLLKDSAKVTVGMTVPVGEVLAEVGNSASIGRPALVYRLVRGDVRVADPLTVVPRFEPFTAIFGGRPLRSSQPPEAGDLVNPD